ncbi:kinesin-associated protein 3-like [Ornithodoros turicata]|uniref:Putative kinesin associated protein kap n=1 Tax=Ornithodoros turicata TaxID=34597 RepID=A0A2R5L4V8_9ACAR
MMEDDAKCVQRKIRKCAVDVHPTENALVVSYELEGVFLAGTVLEHSRECQKLIRLKRLNETTDVAALAREVVHKCSILPESKTTEVEQLINYLQCRGDTTRSSSRVSQRSETASISKTESYVEMLYEDAADKVRGSALVLRLARNPENLGELCMNDTLLCALARVLREDGRKNMELATNIVYIFFCFSTFSQFHSVITEYKIGSVCMDLIDFEQRRHTQWREDLARKATEDGTEYEKGVRKYHALAKRQNQLLRVAYYLLLNLAEHPKSEIKMVNRGIVPMLVKSLERDDADLLLLVVSFLKKLSVYYENTAEMAKLGVIQWLAPLLPSRPDLQNALLRLLLNLSFDLELRAGMVRVGLLPKLVDLLRDPTSAPVVLCILYHISMDDRCKSHFTYTDCIPIIVKLLLHYIGECVPLEPAALAINLAASKRNAQLICEHLDALVGQAFRHHDPVLMKVIRNISQHDGPTKTALMEHTPLIASALQSVKNEEFVLECIGTLGNLNVPEMNFSGLLQEHRLVQWIKEILESKESADDMLLEVVVLVGTVTSCDVACAHLLVEGGIVLSLTNLLGAKQEDDELVLQIVYAYHGLLRHDAVRLKLVQDSKVPAYLLDLLHDQNPEVRRVCNNALDLVAECEQDWAKRIQRSKFRQHNAQWLDMVERCLGTEEESDEPPFADSDLLERFDLLSNGSWASDP